MTINMRRYVWWLIIFFSAWCVLFACHCSRPQRRHITSDPVRKWVASVNYKPWEVEDINYTHSRFEYRIVKVNTIHLYTTCYSEWDSGKPKGSREIYANDDKTKMPISERRIRYWHYTVAINKTMEKYHEAMIQIPEGTTHRYRFHVPYYNHEVYQGTDHYTGRLSNFNSDYFSVPRDRMPKRDDYSNRIDVLYTGPESRCKDKEAKWHTTWLPIDVYEIKLVKEEYQ